MKKIFLILATISYIVAGNITIQYWKVPQLSYMDFPLHKRDIKYFSNWINNRNIQISIFNGIKNEYSIRPFALDYYHVCVNHICIIVSPLYDNKVHTKVFLYRDVNHIYKNKPVMFDINHRIGIVVVDLKKDKNYMLKIQNIDDVVKYFAKESGIPLQHIIVVGDFKTKDIESFVNFKSALKHPNKIHKNKLIYSDNILIPKHLKVSKVKIQYNTKDRKTFTKKASDYLPFQFTIKGI